MMKILKLFCRSESGNVVVMFAMSITCLLGMTAAVIDGGRVYHEKSVLQNAMDAAALGGAQGIVTSEATAASIAKDISAQNAFPIDESNLTITNESIRVTRSSTVPMTFAKILGINEVPVTASAKAEVALLKSTKGVTPIAVEVSAIPNGTELKCTNTGANNGNCGFLDIDGSGANGLAEGIINGSTVGEGYSYATTEPGQKWGPVEDAFQTLINNDADKPHCQSASTADNSCDRVIIVTVINSWEDAEGKSTVEVVGLAAYWINRVENPKRIIGEFIKMVSFGEIGGTGSGNIYGVKLVE